MSNQKAVHGAITVGQHDRYLGQVTELLDELNAAGVAYQILSDSEEKAAIAWLEGHFPVNAIAHIVWQDVPRSINRRWNDYSDLSATFRLMCDDLGLGDLKVLVMWSTGPSPVLELYLNAIRRYGEQIFAAQWDTFVFSPEHGWCVEAYHEGDLCFGRVQQEY